MRNVAFFLLIVIALISALPKSWGFEISSNTVAISLMILLLVLFSEMVEFNFWGLKGRKNTPKPPEPLAENTVLSQDMENTPSKYKLGQAQKDENVAALPATTENFFALSFDVERLLRIIARSYLPKMEIETILAADKVDEIIQKENVLTSAATAALSHIRDFRHTLLVESLKDIPVETLEDSHALAQELHTQLASFINKPKN